MPSYRVKRKCFINGVLLEPKGKHDPYFTEEKLDPVPSSLELIPDDVKRVAKKKAAKKSAAPQAPKVQGVKMKGEDVEFEQNGTDVS